MNYKLPNKEQVLAGLKIVGHVLSTRKFWTELLLMTVAMFASAMAVHYFLKPSGLIVGSVTGLGLVLNAILPVMSVGTYMMIINAILLVLSFLLLGNEFGMKTVYTAMILGPFVDLMAWLDPMDGSMFAQHFGDIVVQNPWFDMLCFVVALSLAQSILFSINASTGGLDILTKIVNKFAHVPIGVANWIAGGAICATAFATNPVGLVIMGLIGTWINGLCIDFFMGKMSSRTRVYLISDQWEKINNFIVHEIQRGVTLHKVMGGYSHEEHYQLECILTQSEFSKLLDFIRAEKLNPFITSDPVSEVYGLWRKKNNHQAGWKPLKPQAGTPDQKTF